MVIVNEVPAKREQLVKVHVDSFPKEKNLKEFKCLIKTGRDFPISINFNCLFNQYNLI